MPPRTSKNMQRRRRGQYNNKQQWTSILSPTGTNTNQQQKVGYIKRKIQQTKIFQRQHATTMKIVEDLQNVNLINPLNFTQEKESQINKSERGDF